jgi:hypothetical protein
MKIIDVKPRSRAGTWDSFAKRYGPIDGPDGSTMWHFKDLPAGIEDRRVWTVVDCDGTLYVVPGYHTVNYLGRVVTTHGWSDTEESNPGYVY